MLQLDEFKLDSPEFARLSGLAPGSFYRRPEAYSQSGLKWPSDPLERTNHTVTVANVTRMLDVDHTGRSVTDDRQRDW